MLEMEVMWRSKMGCRVQKVRRQNAQGWRQQLRSQHTRKEPLMGAVSILSASR